MGALPSLLDRLRAEARTPDAPAAGELDVQLPPPLSQPVAFAAATPAEAEPVPMAVGSGFAVSTWR